jgi:hypothetical protein
MINYVPNGPGDSTFAFTCPVFADNADYDQDERNQPD